jgi:hypothetical protein
MRSFHVQNLGHTSDSVCTIIRLGKGEEMKKIIVPLLISTIFLFACTITIPTPNVTEPPVVANTTCNNLSFYLDPLLGSGYSCETILENPEGIEVIPQYTKLTINGYPLSGMFFEAHIMVFPIQRYTELMPDAIPAKVSLLQTLTAGGAIGDDLPFLPLFNAAQLFHAQYRVVPFTNGDGIRYLTEFAQYYAPINNHDIFYTYQGISQDGLYWVTAIFPINNAILAANSDNPPAGMENNYDSYTSGIADQLNSQTTDSFTPSLTSLDNLVGSIAIAP